MPDLLLEATIVVGWLVLFVGAICLLAYRRASLAASTGVLLVLLAVYWALGAAPTGWKAALSVPFALLFLFNVRPLRIRLLTRPFMKKYLKLIPAMSSTERETLWAMLDDWDITHRRADLPEAVSAFIKSSGFFAMIIPKHYGGLEFSAYAHSCVLIKIASRSATASSTIAVPNSLGPAELLLHYGTEEQKNHFLPRLARGEEVPCFALTGPRAGSDAASIPDTGVICRGQWRGQETIG